MLSIPSNTVNLTEEYQLDEGSPVTNTGTFEENIRNKLSLYLDDVDGFLDALYNTNALMTGSFVLSCIYEDFEANDIDIYLKVPHLDGHNEAFTILKYMQDNNHLWARLRFFDKKREDPAEKISIGNILRVIEFYSVKLPEGEDYRKLRNHIENLEDISNHDGVLPEGFSERHSRDTDFSEYLGDKKIIRIQFILLLEDPQEFIDNSFDLEFCKVTYNGRKLHISNLDSVVQKRSYLFPNLSLIRYFMIKEGVDEDEALQIREEKRLSKYLKRGFDVEKHYFYDEILEYFRSNMRIDRCFHIDVGRYIPEEAKSKDGTFYFIKEQLGEHYGKMFEADFDYIMGSIE